ncbi:MAG: DUF1592 domain-containing protein [Planctomycetes bacterium]|nr:DUF1592 domain-containing protein [Planctomycetota bacterium]
MRLASSILFAALATTFASRAQDLRGAPAELAAFVREHCARCHGEEETEADLDLVRLVRAAPDAADAAERAADWLDVRDVLSDCAMPPEEEPQPEPAARANAIEQVRTLLAALKTGLGDDPGRVTMRRLSRVELANSIRDLCGVAIDPGELPADDLAYGFDNVGDALTLSPLHLEKLAAIAERVAATALPEPDPATPGALRFLADQLTSSLDGGARGESLGLYTNGVASCRAALPRAGRYRVAVTAWATQAGDELARLVVRADDRAVDRFEVAATRQEPGVFTVEVDLPAVVTLGAAFVNDHWDPQNQDASRRDRNLYVQGIEIAGPLDPREPTIAERWLAPFEPSRGTPFARARPVVRELLRRAWRRPGKAKEVDRLARLAADTTSSGDTFRGGLRAALAAALVSPSFLFRVEPQARPASAPVDLDGWALATRLSYYLWSSLPDDALLARAKGDALRDPAALLAESRRMLLDPRADALATNFAAQWLELRKLDNLAPDPDRFPGYTKELGHAMRRETELLVRDVLRTRRPVRDLLLADHAFVDATLARHYGLDDVAPDATNGDFVRVELSGRRLGGLLGQGSILAITSHPTRTSPVRRGRWILDAMLADPPPPPAPGADSFPPQARLDTPADMRAQLARHREDAACAVCHDRIDPLGLALEGYDPLGRTRVGDIDVAGRLPDGRSVDGPEMLCQVLAQGRAFPRAVLHKLFVFALGREPRPADAIALDDALAALPDPPTLEDLVLAVPKLSAFRRRGPASNQESR